MKHEFWNGVELEVCSAHPRYKTCNLHEPVTEYLFSLALRDIDGLVVNVGACFGYYVCFARQYRPDLPIRAVEQTRHRCDLIEQNCPKDIEIVCGKLKPEHLKGAAIVFADIDGDEIPFLIKHGTCDVPIWFLGTHKGKHAKAMRLFAKNRYRVKFQAGPGKLFGQADGLIWAHK